MSGDEQGIIFGQLCNRRSLEPSLAVYFSIASHELWLLLVPSVQH